MQINIYLLPTYLSDFKPHMLKRLKHLTNQYMYTFSIHMSSFKKILYRWLTYTLLISLFSGCTHILNFGFDYFELAHFHKNGSGKIEIIFSMDRAQKLIALGERMIPEYIEFVHSFIDDTYADAAKRLASVPGISKIVHKHDQHTSHFGLSFHFKSIKALNKAMEQVLKADLPGMTYFQLNERKFVRTYSPNRMGKLLEVYRQNDDSLTKSFDLSFFFRNMRYITQYSFASEINKASNPLAMISEHRKRITVIGNMLDANDKVTLTTNQIIFKTSAPAKQKNNSLTPNK